MNSNNCISYWFPKIKAAGVPVPRTELVRIKSDNVFKDLCGVLDGKPLSKASQPFFKSLRSAVNRIGKVPLFLRTGHGSGKHQWDRCCYVADIEKLPSHVCALIEWSECAGFLGLPWNVWAVREMLKTHPIGVCKFYGNFPVCREFRVFADAGDVRCLHSYWPHKALIKGGLIISNEDYRKFIAASKADVAELKSLAVRASKAVGGFWSIDCLETDRGWYVTDMADANESWHLPSCRNKFGVQK